jgi:hypothetical protein
VSRNNSAVARDRQWTAHDNPIGSGCRWIAIDDDIEVAFRAREGSRPAPVPLSPVALDLLAVPGNGRTAGETGANILAQLFEPD